jgi:hypothetical protein
LKSRKKDTHKLNTSICTVSPVSTVVALNQIETIEE